MTGSRRRTSLRSLGVRRSMEYLETPGRAGLVISGPRADLVISLDSFTVIGLVGGAPAQGWGGSRCYGARTSGRSPWGGDTAGGVRQLPSVLQAAKRLVIIFSFLGRGSERAISACSL